MEADGADSLKENVPGVREIKIHFAEFLRLLIDSFTRELDMTLSVSTVDVHAQCVLVDFGVFID